MSKKPICNAPFSQILLSPTGRTHPCCYHFGADLGSATGDLQSVWNGPRIKNLRQEFLSGKPKTCKSRINNLACYKDFEHLSPDIAYDIHQDNPPKRLDLRLNGMCNLRCVMCDVWEQPNGLHDHGFIWKEGASHIFPYLKEVDILGGEPFIQKDTFRLIDEIHGCNKDCWFSFITNAQFLNSIRVEKILQRIKVKRIQISMDAASEATFKVIRRGGDWQRFHSNLKMLAGINSKTIVSFCALKQNWREIPAFFQFCQDRCYTGLLQMAFYDPSHISGLMKGTIDDLKMVRSTLLSFSDDPDYIAFLEPVLQLYIFDWRGRSAPKIKIKSEAAICIGVVSIFSSKLARYFLRVPTIRPSAVGFTK